MTTRITTERNTDAAIITIRIEHPSQGSMLLSLIETKSAMMIKTNAMRKLTASVMLIQSSLGFSIKSVIIAMPNMFSTKMPM
jgi:hypothetical protein